MDNTAVFYTVNMGSIPVPRTKTKVLQQKRFDNKSSWCYNTSIESDKAILLITTVL